eukprot:3376018-Prymnesium_polylepis.1
MRRLPRPDGRGGRCRQSAVLRASQHGKLGRKRLICSAWPLPRASLPSSTCGLLTEASTLSRFETVCSQQHMSRYIAQTLLQMPLNWNVAPAVS